MNDNITKGKTLKHRSRVQVPALDLEIMNKDINPADDFFRYASGGWLANTKIPSDKSSYSCFDMLRDKRDQDLKELLQGVFTASSQNRENELIRCFYRSGMNSRYINKSGIEAIEEELNLIDSVNTRKDLVRVMAEFYKRGIKSAFSIYAAQDEIDSSSVIANFLQSGTSLPDKDYYLRTDAASKRIRSAFLRYIKALFQCCGNSACVAKESANTVLNIETEFARKSFSRLELRDTHKNYNPCSLSDLSKLCPEFDFVTFCTILGIQSDLQKINVGQKIFFENFSAMFKRIKLSDWKILLRLRLLNTMAPYLGRDFEQAHFDFYSAALSGVKKMKPRWKKIMGVTSSALGEVIGKLYVGRHFPPENKKMMLTLVDNLKKSLSQRLEELDWMSPNTRKHALKKLNNMGVKIGYPDKWTDYSSLSLGKSFARNVLSVMAFDVSKNLNRLGKAVDRVEWEMTPQTINAYYHPSMNEIVFPAAILQPPFFNADADLAVNYGAIGTIIGHEMTHAFDDQGREFDANGNLRCWWSPKDIKNFTQRAEVLVRQYEKYSPVKGLHIDGKLTLGENIADVGGLKVSFLAFKQATQNSSAHKIKGALTPEQRFFVSFAQCFRGVFRKEYQIRLLREDVHSPVEFRVNGAVANLDVFYAAFNAASGCAMYIAPENRVKIW